MHSPTFPGTFSSNSLMYICVNKLQNIHFNMKDCDYFGKCNFSFLYLRQSLLLFADTLLCKWGIWGLLRAPEAVTVFNFKTFQFLPHTKFSNVKLKIYTENSECSVNVYTF